MEKKIKTAVVGLNMGLHHAYAYHMSNHAELRWVVDLDAEKAGKLAAELGCGHTHDLASIVHDVDAVSICTPHHLHGPQSLMAIQAGKHVLVEKPLANTEAECVQLIQEAERQQVTLMLAYVVRYLPAVVKLKEIVDSKQYGEVFHADCWVQSYLEPRPGSWFAQKDKLGGGTLFSHGCHYIDILQWLLGNPEEVVQLGTHKGTEWMEGEGTSHSVMKFTNGALAHLLISWGMKYKQSPARFHLHTPDACIVLNNGMSKIDVVHAGGTETVFEDEAKSGPGNRVLFEIEHFLDSIRTGRKPSVDGYEGLKSHCIIWAMERHEASKPRI